MDTIGASHSSTARSASVTLKRFCRISFGMVDFCRNLSRRDCTGTEVPASAQRIALHAAQLASGDVPANTVRLE